MQVRSFGERVAQTILFETLGIALVMPFYATATGRGVVESTSTLTLVTLAVVLWGPLHNMVFDLVDRRLTGRSSSERPGLWRCVHALSHEITPLIVTLPLLMIVGGHDFPEVLFVNIGLTAFYATYTLLFHLAWDRVRPVA